MRMIGSAAIKLQFPDFPRIPKDVDWAVDKERTHAGMNEFHVISSLAFGGNPICTPDEIYTLKMSHIFYNIKWDKHLFDLIYLQEHGAKLLPSLFGYLREHWGYIHGENKRSDLSLSKDEFFSNALMNQGDHDKLHSYIQDPPTFTKVLIEPNGVEVSEEKWQNLSHEDKLNIVREEVYVMAYERLAGRDYRSAYVWQLKQMVLTHAPLYEAIWIVQHYKELLKPQFNYKEKLDHELQRNHS